MLHPPVSLLPTDEAARLRSLRAYDVLPTLAEPLFDEFVALTAQVFGLPISLISVVEEDEVIYPTNYGMPGNDRQPRAEALCATAIEKARAVVYHDLAVETSATLPPGPSTPPKPTNCASMLAPCCACPTSAPWARSASSTAKPAPSAKPSSTSSTT